MANEYSTLLDKCLEIEGLISLLVQRDDRVPDRLYGLLNDKTESLLNGVRALRKASDNTDDGDEIAKSAIFEEEQLADDPEALPALQSEDADERIWNAEQAITEQPTTHEISGCKDAAGQHPDDTSVEPASEIEVADPETKPVKFKFSINDKFRFRRELFNFSDEEMADALNVAGQMNSVEEIEDYFYNDLCWDPENEDVMDFMNIITEHLPKAGK